MMTEEQVRLIVAMVISCCEQEHGNGITVPVDAIIDGVSKGKDAGDGGGPSGYGYYDKVAEWESEYRRSNPG